MRIILAGGGTGGHLMPGIALAQRIQQEGGTSQVLFLASSREMDVRTLNRYTMEAVHLPAKPFCRNPAAWPKLLANNLGVFRRAWKVIADFAPDAAVGLGGYASFCPLVAARLQRVPIVLLEQNVVPGKATRRLAPFAAEVACQWEETVRYFGVKVTTRVTGNPIRTEILAGGREEAISQMHLDPGKKTLLVIGGSQGARALNDTMIRCAPELAACAPNLQIVHLSGHAGREAVDDAYRRAGIPAETVAFLDDMSLAYRAADLAVSRAGGTTIAELTACGVPAILVPYPHAADDHQRRNARSLADADAAVVFEQTEVTPGRLTAMVRRFLNEPGLIKRMHTASLARGRPEAADVILETLRGYVHTRPGSAAAEALRPEPVAKEDT